MSSEGKFRVTYATLSADNDDLHAAYENGLVTARSWLGQTLTPVVDGKPLAGADAVAVVSPVDTSIVMSMVRGASPDEVDAAVAAARAGVGSWARTPWEQRVALLRAAADLVSERSNELAALMSLEVGKNRLEALGDVEESADLVRYYCDQMEAHAGFDQPMGTLVAAERTRSVLKPYGVWGVISPFNFPMALVAGPVGAALVAGNTVVIKPSMSGTFSAWKFFECLMDAGVPADVVQFVPGGDEPGRVLVDHAGVDGLTFTGSYDAGMSIYRSFATDYPKPVVCEMGGKNAAIVSALADVDMAAEGVARSAFGLSGQKCSACSRVYVAREVHDAFVEALAERARALVVGDPTRRDVFLGPVIDQAAVNRFEQAVEHAQAVGGHIVTGGQVLEANEEGLPGFYVTPTVVTGVAVDDELFRRELFVPFVAVAPVDSLDEAYRLANNVPLGLTAGFFSSDDSEVNEFLDRIHAGVVYVNRRAGATTGAWPGIQPFGGWKGSGSSGKAGGGPYYVQQFMREQSQTVVSSS